MARSLRINYPGAFYHVTFRGNECKNVFKSKCAGKSFLNILNRLQKDMMQLFVYSV